MRFWHTNDRFFSVVSVLGLIFHLPAKWGGGGGGGYASSGHQLIDYFSYCPFWDIFHLLLKWH